MTISQSCCIYHQRNNHIKYEKECLVITLFSIKVEELKQEEDYRSHYADNDLVNDVIFKDTFYDIPCESAHKYQISQEMYSDKYPKACCIFLLWRVHKQNNLTNQTKSKSWKHKVQKSWAEFFKRNKMEAKNRKLSDNWEGVSNGGKIDEMGEEGEADKDGEFAGEFYEIFISYQLRMHWHFFYLLEEKRY